MKRVLHLLLFFTLSGGLFAQSPLDVHYDFVVESEQIDEALYALMDQTGVNIAFSNQLLPKGLTVSANFTDTPLRDILAHLLTGTSVGVDLLGELIIIVPLSTVVTPKRFTLSGTVRDQLTGELLPGANVFTPSGVGTATNEYGFFSLTLPDGIFQVSISYLGYQSSQMQLTLKSDKHLEIALSPSLNLAAEVIVTSSGNENYTSPLSGIHHLGTVMLHQAPALGGEADVQRLTMLLPGVSSGADGFGGISVRGGNIDQNLVLLDGVPIYNSSHLLGLYSVFNPDAVKSIRFLKGVFPARYGGRVSSVLDVRTREGNLREWTGSADLGLTSVRGLAEGPLWKDSLSLLVSARRSLLDAYTYPISRSLRQRGDIDGGFGYYFYDLNSKVQWNKGSKNRFFLSIYTGGDLFNDELAQEFSRSDTLQSERSSQQVRWGNTVGSLRWNHLFGSKLFLNTTLNYSRFYYTSIDQVNVRQASQDRTLSYQSLYSQYKSNNQDWGFQSDFNYLPSPSHHLRFGTALVWHQFQPGAILGDETIQIDTLSPETLELLLNKNPQRSAEFDVYAEDEFSIGDRWSGNLGLRMSMLNTQNTYYLFPQPRLLLTFEVLGSWFLHGSVGRQVQSIHQLSSSGVGLPRDLWVSSTQRIAPIDSWQTGIGTAIRWGKGWEINAEAYYKHMSNLIVFLEGSLIQIDGENWQNEVDVGMGFARGLEFMLQKSFGKTRGWLTYTLSKAEREFDEVNQGKPFPFRLDRRHQANLTVQHQINNAWTLSALWTFSTGMATTLPRQVYDFNQLNLLSAELPPQFPFLIPAIDNGTRNDLRMPNYHRLDLSASRSWSRKRQLYHLDFGMYNAYVQFNPVYYRLGRRPASQGGTELQYVQVALIPVLPFVRFRVNWLPVKERKLQLP
jgi:hypothetical protein